MSDLVPEEAIEAGAMALTEVTKRPWADTLPGARDVLRRNARLSVTAAAPLILAANQPTHALVRTRIGVGRSIVSLAVGVEDAIAQAAVARRDSEQRDYIEIVEFEASVLRGEGDRDGA